MKLYRYVTALETTKNVVKEKLEAAIKESKLFFSHPASFNDPLECTIPITIENYDKKRKEYTEYITSIVNKRLGNQPTASQRSKRIHEALAYGIPLENCLLVCFSTDNSNQLMWSHYANQGNGVCLCYEFPDTSDEIKRQVEWSSQIRNDMNNHGLDLYAAPVTYTSMRPSLHIANTSLPVDMWTFDRDYTLTDAVFTKPKCWEYEQELRFALILPFESEIGFAPGINAKDYYAILPRGWLKEVTFGLRLEDEYCETIQNLFTNSGYSTVEFKKAKLAHGEFRLIVESFRRQL